MTQDLLLDHRPFNGHVGSLLCRNGAYTKAQHICMMRLFDPPHHHDIFQHTRQSSNVCRQLESAPTTASYEVKSLRHQVTLLTEESQQRHKASQAPATNAGSRLCNVAELPEMVLLHLPAADILHAQRASRAFRHTIQRSGPPRRVLWLDSEPALKEVILQITGTRTIRHILGKPERTLLFHPILSRPRILNRLPLYLDAANARLKYLPGTTAPRERVYINLVTFREDMKTGEMIINITVLNKQLDNCGCIIPADQPARDLSAGSWKQMRLSEPLCKIEWDIKCWYEKRFAWYTGITPPAENMDLLLDRIAEMPLKRRLLRQGQAPCRTEM